MGRKDIGNIIEIMKDDFKSAFSNPIVTIILVGIIILPSLYALLNIYACWDPYENTDEIEFAIANLDNGSVYDGKNINVGNELVKDLKNNSKFKWTFVTEDELRDGVYKGEYYAGIIIPRNLSEKVLSITTDHPEQAKLEYIVNIKANPVAAKLTTSASNTVYTTLNAKIVEYINLAAYGKLGELQEGLASGAGQLSSGGYQLQEGADEVSSGADEVSSGADEVSSGAEKIDEGAQRAEEGSEKLKEGSETLQEKTDELNQGSQYISGNASIIEEKSDELEKGSEEIQSSVDPSLIPDGPVKEYAEGNAKLADGSGQLAQGSSKLADGSVQLADGSTKIANGSVYLANKSNELAEGSVKLANGSVQLSEGSVQLSEGSVTLAAGAELLSNAAAQALFTASAALFTSADALSSITGINETLLGDYFFSPVKLDTHELFPVPDYGSSLSPFYLVLSMWVGALITCVMMEPKSSAGTKYSPFEMYAGKLLIYVIMSFLQVCVTLIGAHILGIYVANYPLFILSAMLVSVIFMIVVYSVISAIGTVGKALIVLLLVLQISSTGGIYPIEIMAGFFQMIHPFMPMTYAITLVREAQLGVVWSNYIPALIVLLGIGIATVIVSVIIKEKADEASKYFEERLEESGLF